MPSDSAMVVEDEDEAAVITGIGEALKRKFGALKRKRCEG